VTGLSCCGDIRIDSPNPRSRWPRQRGAVEGRRANLAAGGEEDDRGESLDGNVVVVVGGGVHLGDDDLVIVLETLTKLLVDRLEALAVAAPLKDATGSDRLRATPGPNNVWEMRTGGIELDQDVLVVVDDQLLEGVAYEDGDGTIVGRGGLVRLSRCEQDTVSRG